MLFRAAVSAESYKKVELRDEKLRDVFDGFCQTFRPSIVCDVGAFNGDDSYRFASLLPDSKVVAFEASPRNVGQFYGPNSRFDGLSNFELAPLAISDRRGNITFHELEAGAEASDWRRAASSVHPRNDGLPSKKVEVETTSLDEYFGPEVIDQHTFALWVDVEGALDKVITGARRTLDRTLFIRAEVEWKRVWRGQVLAPQIKKQFERLGFLVVADSHEPNTYKQSDILLLNRKFINLITRT